jgi:hypothetical protein
LLHNSALSTHDRARLFYCFSVDIATDLHNFNTSLLWWRSRLRMRAFLLGVYIVFVIYPFFEEQRQHRADRKRLPTCARISKWVIVGTPNGSGKITGAVTRLSAGRHSR